MAGFSDLEFMQRGRRLVVGAVMLVLGGVVGFALPHSNASPSSQKGSITSVGNAAPDASLRFVFKPAKGSGSETFLLQPATPWQKSPTSRWVTKGLPSCLIPGAPAKTQVTLGVVNTSKVGNADGRSIVVWVQCYT